MTKEELYTNLSALIERIANEQDYNARHNSVRFDGRLAYVGEYGSIQLHCAQDVFSVEWHTSNFNTSIFIRCCGGKAEIVRVCMDDICHKPSRAMADLTMLYMKVQMLLDEEL